MSIIVQLCEAVVYELRQLNLGVPFTAERHYRPSFQLANLQDLKITVVPKSITIDSLDRTRDAHDYEIYIGLHKRKDISLAFFDEMMNITQTVCDHFRTHSLRLFPEAKLMAIHNEPIYAFEHVEELGQFTSLVTLRYRVPR